VQVTVPSAELEEVVPGARLLRRAAALAPPESYEAAKAAFLGRLADAAQAAAGLAAQVEGAAAARRRKKGRLAPARPKQAARATAPASAATPGLQDLRGGWAGTVQAYGGGRGATAADFNLRGANWRWGEGRNSPAALDAVALVGSAHSVEGLRLEEASLKAGAATLLLRGTLLGPAQDARILLADFPVATLTPLLRAAFPLLRHAAPAGGDAGGAGSIFGGLAGFGGGGLLGGGGSGASAPTPAGPLGSLLSGLTASLPSWVRLPAMLGGSAEGDVGSPDAASSGAAAAAAAVAAS